MTNFVDPIQFEAEIRSGVCGIVSIQRINKGVDLYLSLMYWAYSLGGRHVPVWYIFGGDRDQYHFNRAVDALQPVAGDALDVRSIMIDELEKMRS